MGRLIPTKIYFDPVEHEGTFDVLNCSYSMVNHPIYQMLIYVDALFRRV